ncbi:Hemolymph clottable protein [Armadillidium nasatum]|uniref:Hemolymph clottable protein n=1 Tax=Armadillidium nasatum TaxID=96803 RepID=A0A5N5SRD7_9CRUS|nr:Hemolymph clottable protein [Armadillidium nasatum]
MEYFDFKYSFVGKKERNYEIFFTFTQGSNTSRYMRYNFNNDKIEIMSSGIARLVGMTIEREEKEAKGVPLRALYSMSDEGKVETTKKCDKKYSNCKYDNTEFISEWKLFYDTIDIDAFYATKKILARNTYNKNWDIYLKTPSANVLLATYPDSYLFSYFSGVTPYQPISFLDIITKEEIFTDAKCILQRNSKIPTNNREVFKLLSPYIIVYDDKIEIYNENLDKSPANGICGNNDRKMVPEFIGPKNCIYNDAQMFAASWTGQSDDCDATTLEEYRKGIDHFQADCKPYQKNIQDIQMNERCLVFQWKISTFNETNYCISAKPLPFCLEKCQTNKYKRVKSYGTLFYIKLKDLITGINLEKSF